MRSALSSWRKDDVVVEFPIADFRLPIKRARHARLRGARLIFTLLLAFLLQSAIGNRQSTISYAAPPTTRPTAQPAAAFFDLSDRDAKVRELESLIARKDSAVQALKKKMLDALTGFTSGG